MRFPLDVDLNQSMNKKQFIDHAVEMLFGEGSEGLYEEISEVQGEIVRFGDSGPGSMLRLRQSIDYRNGVARRYSLLTGTEPLPMVPYPSYPCYLEQDPYEHDRF